MPYKFTRNKLTKASLEPVDGSIHESLTTFYLNPDTWTETKAAKWVKHEIPGLSDPHQQWVSSGARTITFKALITRDYGEGHLPESSKGITRQAPLKTGTIKRVSKIGALASQVFNIPGLTSSESRSLSGESGSPNLNLSIAEKLAYYRSLTYPITSDKTGLVISAPNLVKLKVGTTLGNRTLNNTSFVVDKVDIDITKQYPNLTPIEAIITFTLTEFVTQVLSSDSNIVMDI